MSSKKKCSRIRRKRKQVKNRVIILLASIYCVILSIVVIKCYKSDEVNSSEAEQKVGIDTKKIVINTVTKDGQPIYQVEAILQNPELPTGCEATAVTMLLNAYGYEVEKQTVADSMKKSKLVGYQSENYAPHPNEAFIGNPYSKHSYGAFAAVMAQTAQAIIDKMGGKHKAYPLYDLTEEAILQKIDRGIPLCIWTSMYNKEIEHRKGWYLIKEKQYTDEYFLWPANEHAVVLIAYDDSTVTVCDPLVGECQYSRESFFRHYKQVGMYALEIVKNIDF